eukprot:4780686-Amphidinium_carterae.1
MRSRPFVMSVEAAEGDEVLVGSPLVLRTPSTARRSLADIQRQVQGGSIKRARRCQGRRFSMVKKKNIRALYNPRVEGDCLFDCLRAALRQIHGQHVSSKCLRRWLQDRLEDVESGTIDKCAANFGLSRRSYIDTTTKGRWGTNLDIEIMAPLLQLPIVLIDCEQGHILFEHVTGDPPVVVCYRNKHFTVCRVARSLMADLKKKKMAGQRLSSCRGGAGKPAEKVKELPQVRPYPLAGAAASSSSGAPEAARQSCQGALGSQARSAPHITIVFHGSFAPFHMGHYRTACSAVEFFAARNVIVDTVLIGFTTERQLRRKLGETVFLCSDSRARVARAVLRDVGDDIMFVDANPVGSSTELAERHEKTDPR